MISKIISGGQTGADRAALDVAIAQGIPYGGWVPLGRLAEDGPLPTWYRLQEMLTPSYSKRTRQNVIDSDGTLIVSHGRLAGGSKLTLELAQKHCKPHLHLDLTAVSLNYAVRVLRSWVADNGVKALNVAGARASKDPEIYEATVKLMESVLGKRQSDPPEAN